MDVWFCECRNHCREAHVAGCKILNMSVLARSSVARVRRTVFSLDNDLHGCQRTEYALVSSLQRDPLLAARLKRLRTVPGVGPITALTWALEIRDVSRFRSVKQAISYCGLCGEEKSSADKVLRTPLSKQRNQPIQKSVLVEAAKLAAQPTYPECTGRSRETGSQTEP